ncbi:MAG: calcium/sodium antiporter [Bacteroidaceae bacterium]|nr:calcium/sodium antiporter [Bacteroidaceae bacterium]
MILDIVSFIAGLVLIIKGADFMTDGSSAVARRYGIPTLVIGMTIVAIGSSAPELVVSSLSSIQGKTDIAIGNVVGSNIFNILSIIGVTAIVAPISASKGNVRNDVPFVVLSSLVIAIATLDTFISDGETCKISRSEGLLMLCLFAIYLSYTLAIAKGGQGAQEGQDENSNIKEMPLAKSIVFIIGGLAALIFGGNLLVNGATGIATTLGVSQSIIALTIVSIGTSLPELAASVMAAKKGDTAMALGNVVGSNIFNIFFVLGISSTISPLGIGNITLVDIATLILASTLFWWFCRTGFAVKKWEGAILIIIQIIYYTYLVING